MEGGINVSSYWQKINNHQLKRTRDVAMACLIPLMYLVSYVLTIILIVDNNSISSSCLSRLTKYQLGKRSELLPPMDTITYFFKKFIFDLGWPLVCFKTKWSRWVRVHAPLYILSPTWAIANPQVVECSLNWKDKQENGVKYIRKLWEDTFTSQNNELIDCSNYISRTYSLNLEILSMNYSDL